MQISSVINQHYLCAFKPSCWDHTPEWFYLDQNRQNFTLTAHCITIIFITSQSQLKEWKTLPTSSFISSLLSELSGGLRMVFWQWYWKLSMCWHTLHWRKVSGWRWGRMTVWGWNGCSCVKLVLVTGVAARCFLQFSH